MSVSDLIADQLTVVRNAIMVGKKTVIIKRSSLLVGVMKIAKKEGFIENFKEIENEKQGQIKVYLRYDSGEQPVMRKLIRVSKPGRREFVKSKNIKAVLAGVGVAVLSTSKGVLTDKEAKEQGVGGEVICHLW
ncbi:MAG: 30S ribosomal protein S8 [Candidatus Omnitrophota bacterium]